MTDSNLTEETLFKAVSMFNDPQKLLLTVHGSRLVRGMQIIRAAGLRDVIDIDHNPQWGPDHTELWTLGEKPA